MPKVAAVAPLAARIGATVLLVAAAAGCGDRMPTESAAPDVRGLSAVSAGPADAPFAHPLGVLPGETTSEATYVTADGVVYGTSGSRFFRWTEATGMQEVASIPSAPHYPIPAGAPLDARVANMWGEATGGPPPYRWSASEGRRPLATDESNQPFDNLSPFTGVAINRWGHVVGALPQCCAENAYVFWTPVDTTTLVGAYTDRVVLSDDDVVYTHLPLFRGDPQPTLRARATSPHLVGGRVDLLPSASAPDAPNAPANCSPSAPQLPLGVTVTAANARLQAVGYQYRACTTYRRAVLWDLRPLEATRPLVHTQDTVVARFGVTFWLPYSFEPRGSSAPWIVRVDWGDRTAATDPGVPDESSRINHVYTTPGTYFARVYVRDTVHDTWGVAQSVVVARTANQPPRVLIRQQVDGPVVAGHEFVMRGEFLDDSPDDGPWTFELEWGGAVHTVASGLQPHGSTYGTEWSGDPIDFHFTYDQPGTYTFIFRVTDAYGATMTSTKTVEVVAAP